MPVHNLSMLCASPTFLTTSQLGVLKLSLRFGREHGMGAGVETEREDQQLNAEQQAAQRDAPMPPGRPCEKEAASVSASL